MFPDYPEQLHFSQVEKALPTIEKKAKKVN